jgi:hypothetical protein
MGWLYGLGPALIEVAAGVAESDLDRTPGAGVPRPAMTPEARASLQRRLASMERRFDPVEGLLQQTLGGPGYHTTLPPGMTVRATRGNLSYAVLLLAEGSPERVQRAESIIRRVLALQDTDPLSPTCGIWPWYFEEPLSQMSPPDWNWADFLGATLAEALILYPDRISADLLAAMRRSLGHAAWAIQRRDVPPDYTNIAILGGGVTALAGELLNEPRLVDYARQRLARVIEHTRWHGSFSEYNSPNYALVVLDACELVLALCRDAGVREHTQELLRLTWEMIAEHYHPGTGEWAGPHSRCYGDRLNSRTAARIAARTGVPLTRTASAEPSYEPFPPVLCPEEFRQRFRALPEPDFQIRRRFFRNDEDASRSLYATTWFTSDACLGTFSSGSFWTQSRPLLAYWKLASSRAAVLKCQFLHNGRDFASASLRTTQDKHRVLVLFGLISNQGSHHLSLDRPPEPIFRAADFRIRFALDAADAVATEAGDGRAALAAGDWQAIISTAPGSFGDYPIRWVSHREDGRVYFDGICYQGPERDFDFRTFAFRAAAAVEILPRTATSTAQPPRLTDRGAAAEASWAGLSVSGPTRADLSTSP